MSSNKISSKDQRKIRNNAKKELERLEQIQNNVKMKELINSFKEKYNLCETVYKVILREHQKTKGKFNKGHLEVTMRQVPYALNFAGYTFDKKLLTQLFGAKSVDGSKVKTVKKLCEAVTHGIDEKALEEIKTHQTELFGYMDSFINIIKTFDQTT